MEIKPHHIDTFVRKIQLLERETKNCILTSWSYQPYTVVENIVCWNVRAFAHNYIHMHNIDGLVYRKYLFDNLMNANFTISDKEKIRNVFN